MQYGKPILRLISTDAAHSWDSQSRFRLRSENFNSSAVAAGGFWIIVVQAYVGMLRTLYRRLSDHSFEECEENILICEMFWLIYL